MIKGAGDPWAGAFITLDNAVDFSAGKTFKVKYIRLELVPNCY